MKREQKEQVVDELTARLKAADTLLVADYRGLTMPQIDELRTRLLASGARFTVVKNTLTRRAAELAQADALLVMLEGPTAIAFIESGGDPAAVAKALATTARETSVLTLRGAILEGKTLSGAEVEELSKLPPFEVMRGQLLGAIVAPPTQLLGLVSAPARDVVGLMAARIRQLEEQGKVTVPATVVATSADDVAEDAAPEETVLSGSDTAEPDATATAVEDENVDATATTEGEEED